MANLIKEISLILPYVEFKEGEPMNESKEYPGGGVYLVKDSGGVYHLAEVFSEQKFVNLWGIPLALHSSIVEHFCEEKFESVILEKERLMNEKFDERIFQIIDSLKSCDDGISANHSYLNELLASVSDLHYKISGTCLNNTQKELNVGKGFVSEETLKELIGLVRK